MLQTYLEITQQSCTYINQRHGRLAEFQHALVIMTCPHLFQVLVRTLNGLTHGTHTGVLIKVGGIRERCIERHLQPTSKDIGRVSVDIELPVINQQTFHQDVIHPVLSVWCYVMAPAHLRPKNVKYQPIWSAYRLIKNAVGPFVS